VLSIQVDDDGKTVPGLSFEKYGDDCDDWMQGVHVRTYINQDFDEDWIGMPVEELYALIPRWLQVCKDQGLDAETGEETFNVKLHDMLLGALGRNKYPLHMHDAMRFLTYIFGDTTTGKTVIRDSDKKAFYGSKTGDYCCLSGKASADFGLEKTEGVNIIFMQDITKQQGKDFPISCEQLKNLVDGGEDTDVNRKGKKQIDIDVAAPILIDSNVTPDKIWPAADDQKPLAKRIMLFSFETEIADGDLRTSLIEDITTTEALPLLVLQIKMYQWLIDASNRQPFSSWDIDYFKQTRAAINPLAAFLQATPDDSQVYCVYEEDSEVTRMEFQQAFQKYCEVERIRVDIKREMQGLKKALDATEYVLTEPPRSGPGAYYYQCKSCGRDVDNDLLFTAGGACCVAYARDARAKSLKATRKRMPVDNPRMMSKIEGMKLA
jgi:hypothetical protein